MTQLQLRLLLVFLGLQLLSPTLSYASDIDMSKAAAVMSAYLRHIANFTNLPEDDVINADQDMRFGLIGGDPNGVIQRIRDRTESGGELLAKGRPIRVVMPDQQPDTGENATMFADCALLFVSEGSEDQWVLVQPKIRKLPIVTVSEMQGFVDLGGMVEYFVERRTGKVRMKVNLQAARDAGISFSSNFLNLDSVIPLKEPEERR